MESTISDKGDMVKAFVTAVDQSGAAWKIESTATPRWELKCLEYPHDLRGLYHLTVLAGSKLHVVLAGSYAEAVDDLCNRTPGLEAAHISKSYDVTRPPYSQGEAK